MTHRLDELISEASHSYPDNIALIEESGSISYKDLDKKIEALAGHLIIKGLRKGERAALLSRNSIEFIISYFAICRAGAVAVPLNHSLHYMDLVKISKDCSISAIFTGKGLEEKSRHIIDEVKSVKFLIDEPAAQEAPVKTPHIKDDDLCSIVYTSGTMGDPMGVMLSHRNILSNAGSIVRYMNIGMNEKVLCVLPFYYMYGLSVLFSYLLAKATIIIENRFMYPKIVLDAIDACSATAFAGVSSHYSILLYNSDFKNRELSSIKYFMQAGDAMPLKVTKEIIRLFPKKKLYIMYGQTEASPRLTYLEPALAGKKPGSVGKAIPGVCIKIVNEQGKECGIGETGEITVSGDNIMLGYWGRDKETLETIRGGLLYTGDLAFKDNDGDIFLVGRKKSFIKIGANKANPAYMEDVVKEDQRVLEAAVIGLPDRILGHRLKLFVEPVPGVDIKEKDVMDICKSRLPAYMIPGEIAVLRVMPRNSLGKIDKDKLI